MIRFHAFSFFLSRNKREESARKDACSILCLLFAFQDCFCSSSQIILAVISIEKTASERIRQARTFLLMICPISFFSSLSLECGVMMLAPLSFAQKLYTFCSESTRKEAGFSSSTAMIIMTDEFSTDKRTLGFLGPARRQGRGSEVLRHGARHAHHRQRVGVTSSSEKELGGGIPCDAKSAIHVGRVDEALLHRIRHRASSPVSPKSNFLSSPPRKLQSSAFSSPLQLAQSSPSLSRSTSTAVVHHQIGDRVGKNLSVRFPPPSAPPLKVPPKQSRCSSDSTYKSYAPRARLAIIPTNKKRSAARLPASEWTPAVPTWLEARRKQFATKLALKQRSAAQKEAANLLLRQSFEVGSPLRRPIVVRSGSPLPLISTTGGLRCTHDAAVQSRLPGSIFIPITV